MLTGGFSALASDVDTNKIINIIQTKMVEEEKRIINSVLVKEDDVVIEK